MIAPVAALRHRRAAELAGPDDQRVVEHAALLEVGDQRHAGAVDLLGLERDAVLDAAVVVPVLVVELDEAHAALGQPAGEQAVAGKGTIARLAAVELERLGLFAATGPSAPARWPASGRPSRTARCAWRSPGSSTSVCCCRLSALMAAHVGPLLLARDARRAARDRGPGSPLARSCTPW